MLRLLPLTVVALALGFAACGGGGSDEAPDPTAATDAEATSESEPTAAATATSEAAATPVTDATVGVAAMARTVAQIVAFDANRNIVWTGSGTVISTDGLILTNAHVVDDRFDEYDALGIAVTERTDRAPKPSFIAEIVAVDYVLDIAVVRVISDLAGEPADFDLPAIAIGDSEAVELGDPIQILGFPGIGGATITFTQGTISGFNAQQAIADRAWIKTDATIAGGNSGGLAANAAGEIIGIPTIAASNEQVDPVDCRVIVDTNRDGAVNDDDTCVPIGGFLNGLRPIALALPLIAAATAGEAYVSAFGDLGGGGSVSGGLEDASFDDLIFADGVEPEETPTNVVAILPAAAPAACAFWDYEGMVDGVTWEALWFVNGELNEIGSVINET